MDPSHIIIITITIIIIIIIITYLSDILQLSKQITIGQKLKLQLDLKKVRNGLPVILSKLICNLSGFDGLSIRSYPVGMVQTTQDGDRMNGPSTGQP